MTKETTLNEFNDSNALNEIHEVEEKMKISTAEIKIQNYHPFGLSR